MIVNLIITLELIFAVALVGAAARRVPLPAPILYIIAGVALSFIPQFGQVRLEPALFFALFIPPLLFADGWLIPKRELFAAMRPILLLAFGLVTLTVVVVGYVVHWMIPSIPLAAAFALGAVVSPTDAVAVAAIAEKLRLPRRVVILIGGESLINDASGLVAFKFAVAAMATGVFSTSAAATALALVSIGGTIIGVVIAWLIGVVRVWLDRHALSEPTIQGVLSLLTPFAAYLVAEHFHASGILAIVAAGVYAGMHDTRTLSTENRLHTWEIWSWVLFVLNGLVFLLLGLQLRSVFAGAGEHSWTDLAGYSVVLVLLVIVLRVVWMYPGAWIPRWMSRRIRASEPPPTFGAIAIVSWAGIRGAVTLAAALSIPLELAPGVPFPERDLIILLATSVILGTLLINGLSLPAVIRRFGVTAGDEEERETLEARLSAAQAAINALTSFTNETASVREQVAARMLIGEYHDRVLRLRAEGDVRRRMDVGRDLEQRLRCVALAAERDALFHLRDTNRINEAVLRVVQRELDFWESAHFASDNAAER